MALEHYTAVRRTKSGENPCDIRPFVTGGELRKGEDGWEIALETGKLMEKYDAVIWAHHGMFCSGEDFDLTFGLLHTVEKSAEILVKILSMAPQKLQTITPNDFRALAKDFKVTLPEEFLYEKK